MIYEKDEIHPEAVVRIADPVFEGYAILISADGELFSEMESDLSRVTVAQRWRVQFLPVKPELQLTISERFTQAAQKERITHRVIRFNAGCFTTAYKKYGGEQSDDSIDRDLLPDIFLFDSF